MRVSMAGEVCERTLGCGPANAEHEDFHGNGALAVLAPVDVGHYCVVVGEGCWLGHGGHVREIELLMKAGQDKVGSA